MAYDAEGRHDGVPCPDCGSTRTISWHYQEGFDELECRDCGFRSDAEDLDALRRESGDVLRSDDDAPFPPPDRPIRA